MYPNLYYVFKAWFGVEWKGLQFLNTFGLMVAMGFLVAAFFISLELKRKEKQGLLFPRDETILVGKPASFIDLLINFITGFLFGYKMIGLFIDKPDAINPQDYIFSTQGNIIAGIARCQRRAYCRTWFPHDKRERLESDAGLSFEAFRNIRLTFFIMNQWRIQVLLMGGQQIFFMKLYQQHSIDN